ncbi:sensor histidine kinase [Altericroceibacterium endophyticum]|nr:HAMP domain-containing sensor histidine kinase [Altericroceibacterium endophyticum]
MAIAAGLIFSMGVAVGRFRLAKIRRQMETWRDDADDTVNLSGGENVAAGPERLNVEDLVTEKAALEQRLEETEALQRETETQLLKTQGLAEKRLKILGQVSHDLRTPVSGIVGMVDQAKDDPRSATRAKAFEIIELSAYNLLRTLDNAVEEARLEAGAPISESGTFNPKAMMEKIVTDLQRLAQRKGIILQNNGSCSETLSGNPARVEQVLTNLMTSLIKFSVRQEIVIGCVCRPDSPPGTTLAHFYIEDRGRPSSKDGTDYLFDTVERLASNHPGDKQQAGLSLTICSRLAHEMGGQIGIEDAGPDHRRVFFEVPLKQQTTTETSEPLRSALLIDRSATGKLTASALLSQLGFKVECRDDLPTQEELTHYEFVICDADTLSDDDWPGTNMVADKVQVLALVSTDNTKLKAKLADQRIPTLNKPLDIAELHRATTK